MAATVTKYGHWYTVVGTRNEIRNYLRDNNVPIQRVAGIVSDGTDVVMLVKL